MRKNRQNFRFKQLITQKLVASKMSIFYFSL